MWFSIAMLDYPKVKSISVGEKKWSLPTCPLQPERGWFFSVAEPELRFSAPDSPKPAVPFQQPALSVQWLSAATTTAPEMASNLSRISNKRYENRTLTHKPQHIWTNEPMNRWINKPMNQQSKHMTSRGWSFPEFSAACSQDQGRREPGARSEFKNLPSCKRGSIGSVACWSDFSSFNASASLLDVNKAEKKFLGFGMLGLMGTNPTMQRVCSFRLATNPENNLGNF